MIFIYFLFYDTQSKKFYNVKFDSLTTFFFFITMNNIRLRDTYDCSTAIKNDFNMQVFGFIIQ